MAQERRSRKAAETRESLLQAALDVMSSKGYSDATIDEIAQAAGVSKGLAYYHFRSKAEMATEILDNGISDLIMRFERVADSCDTGRDALIGMLDEFTTSIIGNLCFGKFYLSALWRDGHALSEEMKEKDAELVKVIADQFARAQEEGELRKEMSPEFCAVSAIGLVLTSSMYYFGMENSPKAISSEKFRSDIIDFVTNAAAIHS